MLENIIESNEDSQLKQYYSRYGGFWVYPEMLDFCYLVNPYFNRSKIMDEMQDHFRMLVSEYPAGINVNSRLASNCWHVKTDYIIPGNGAAELIKELMANFKGKVGVIRPTFEEYPNRLDCEQVIPYIPRNSSFRYGVDELIDYYENKNIDTLLMINPDNPSGNFIEKEDLHRLAKWCETHNVRLILDESFVDFSQGFRNNSFISDSILEQYPHMCVMKSISKSYGVPGLRLGILCSADTELIAKMKKQISIWNINSFAEFFMEIFPKYQADYDLACEQFIQTRKDFETELAKIPYIKVMPSQANYFFLEVLPPYTSKQLSAILLEKYNILVSACLAKKGIEVNRYMRIAVRSHSDNARLVKAMRELIK